MKEQGGSLRSPASKMDQEGAELVSKLDDVYTEPRKIQDTRPTYDQLYLAEMIDRRWDTTEITMAGIQRLNSRYGVQIVQQAMRELHGFPPSSTLVARPYPYLETVCRRMQEEA